MVVIRHKDNKNYYITNFIIFIIIKSKMCYACNFFVTLNVFIVKTVLI